MNQDLADLKVTINIGLRNLQLDLARGLLRLKMDLGLFRRHELVAGCGLFYCSLCHDTAPMIANRFPCLPGHTHAWQEQGWMDDDERCAHCLQWAATLAAQVECMAPPPSPERMAVIEATRARIREVDAAMVRALAGRFP